MRPGNEVRFPAWLTVESDHFLAHGTACAPELSPSLGKTLKKRSALFAENWLSDGRNDRDEDAPRPTLPTVKKGQLRAIKRRAFSDLLRMVRLRDVGLGACGRVEVAGSLRN